MVLGSRELLCAFKLWGGEIWGTNGMSPEQSWLWVLGGALKRCKALESHDSLSNQLNMSANKRAMCAIVHVLTMLGATECSILRH